MGIVEKLYKMGFIEHYKKIEKGYIIRFEMGDSFDFKEAFEFFETFGLEVVNVRIEKAFMDIAKVIIYLEGKQYAE